MNRPEPGIATPIALRRVRDADTVEVSIAGSAFVWAIRLIGVWAPELHRGDQQDKAVEGRRWLTDYLQAADPANLLLYVPLPKGENILKSLTFDRIPGVIFNGLVNVNELLVVNGFASSVKGGSLGT